MIAESTTGARRRLNLTTIDDVPGPLRLRADYIIVGTGPGGATAGRVLAEAGYSVIFIEEGRHYPVASRRPDSWSAFKAAWRDTSLQVARGRAFWPILQGCSVGGTTPVNGAIVHRAPASIVDGWVKEGRLGDLLNNASYERAFDILDRELSVAATPESVWGNNNALFKRGADALGIASNPIRRNVQNCVASSRCTQGCPSGAKLSMDETFLPHAVSNGAQILSTCRAERIVVEHGRAVGVEARFRDPLSGRPGSPATLEAARGVIVACGVVHTPLLLRTAGIHRQSKQLGRNFMGHPGTAIIARFDEPVELFHGATQGYESTHYWSERMKFETVGVPPGVAGSRLPGFGETLERRLRDLPYMAHWGLQVRAEARGRVKRGFGGRPSITYSFTPRDVATMKVALRRLVELAFAAGARSVVPGVHGLPDEITSVDQLAALDQLPDDPRLFHGICAHLFGTAGIGADASQGVVNERGETFGVEGLYVVDASVLPTNMGVNPQHTICATSWLMAEALAS